MIRWRPPGPYEIAFSTREGGVSEGPYASLNLGRATADEPERVNENRRRLCAEVGAEPDALAMNYQHHSADVLRARAGSRGARGDGIWTDERGLPVLVLAADCLPIALARANGSEPALALLHAGWRGLLEGIVPAGVSALGSRTVAAAVGPAIGPCCYEVGEDVADRFRRAFGSGSTATVGSTCGPPPSGLCARPAAYGSTVPTSARPVRRSASSPIVATRALPEGRA
jgi:YfiH family protein